MQASRGKSRSNAVFALPILGQFRSHTDRTAEPHSRERGAIGGQTPGKLSPLREPTASREARKAPQNWGVGGFFLKQQKKKSQELCQGEGPKVPTERKVLWEGNWHKAPFLSVISPPRSNSPPSLAGVKPKRGGVRGGDIAAKGADSCFFFSVQLSQKQKAIALSIPIFQIGKLRLFLR